MCALYYNMWEIDKRNNMWKTCIGMNTWRTYFKYFFVTFLFLSQNVHQIGCTQSYVKTNAVSTEFRMVSRNMRHKTCANTGIPHASVYSEVNMSLPLPSIETFGIFERDSIHLQRCNLEVADFSPKLPQKLDYDSAEVAEEYFCDPSSSNCPRELEVTGSHPVQLSRKDITLPYNVKSFTLDIVLDIEAFVEFHEAENDHEGTTVSMMLSSNKGYNHGDFTPSLNYRMASLGQETEVLVFLSENGNPHPGYSRNIFSFLSENSLLLSTLVSLFLLPFGLMWSLTLHKSGFRGDWMFSYRGAVGTGPDRKSRSCGQADAAQPDSIDRRKQADNRRPGLLHEGYKRQARTSDNHSQAKSVETQNLMYQPREWLSLDRDKKQTDSPSTPSLDLRGAIIKDEDNGCYETRPLLFSLADQRVSLEQASPISQPQPRSLAVAEQPIENDHLFLNQEATSGSSHNHRHHITRDTMSTLQTSRQTQQSPHRPNLNDPEADMVSTASLWTRPIRKRVPLRGLGFILFGTFVLVAVAVGVSKIRAKPTLHVVFPGKDVVRKVRMFSDFPDLSRLSKNHSSLSLVSRLQLLDTKRCRDQLQECKVSIVCDPTTRQGANCRCRTGYYFMNWECHECRNTCPAGHYLVSSCSTDADAICKACTSCGETQYEAAPCATDRDTICMDVSFPVGILPMNRSHLQDDGLRISVTHSPNVFLERLADMVALETPMIITNNQQGLLFVWPRTSGLEIAVQVTGVYLVPEYRDVDARDDTDLFSKLVNVPQTTKNYYTHAQENFCRHPVPDFYALQLLEEKERVSAAEIVVCDSKDPKIAKCPPKYKDGDRFVHRSINKACAKLGRSKRPDKLVDMDNSVVCSEETGLLRDVYNMIWPEDVKEYMFPGPNCVELQHDCSDCMNKAGCPKVEIRNYTFSLEDNRCCGIKCFNQSHCKGAYSASCPHPQVECAEGKVDIFSLFPEFHSMEREFSCHLEYIPPDHLYSLSYAIRVPSIGLNISEKYFAVTPTSPSDHEKRLSRFDFIQGYHDTRFPVKEELILQGDHAELNLHGNLFKPYRARWIKSTEELSRHTRYTTDMASLMTYVQFEKPFLYSSSTWRRDGCYKNMTQIYPNQTIYGDDVLPVLARKTKLTKSPTDSEVKKFSYQMHHSDREPFVKFFVDAKESILQYVQGSAVHGILVPSSLYGRVTWHHDSSTWQLLFAGRQMNCPTVISLKIFTQMITGCAGHFDMLINCPEDFTVTFNLSTAVSDLPDVFVLQANDSRTSHNLVLSSLYSPLLVDELTSRSSAELTRKLTEGAAHHKGHGSEQGSRFIVHVWLPLLAVVITAVILLLLIYGCYSYINANIPRIDYKASMGNGNVGNTSLGVGNSSATSNPSNNGGTVDPPVIVVALNNQGEKTNHLTTTTTIASKGKTDASRSSNANEKNELPQRSRCIIVVFIILYIIYSLVFSFSATFGTLYLTQSHIWSNVSNPENLAQELHVQVNRSLSEIKDFERVEREKIFDSFLERRRACVRHLELENSRLLNDYDTTMKKQLHTIFVQNGTLHQFTAEIQRQNVSAYISQIKQFVQDCNKTVNSIVDLFRANYLRFLRNTAHNEWLEVPRQIFLRQEGDSNIFAPTISSRRVKQFAAWLDIDKVQELLNVEENVFGRLSSLAEPQVTTLDMTFPSAHPGTPPVPTFNSEYQTFSYIPLDPSLPSTDTLKPNVTSLVENMPRVTSFSALGDRSSFVARRKRDVTGRGNEPTGSNEEERGDYDSFGLSGSLKANLDSSEFSGEILDNIETPRSSVDKDNLSDNIAKSSRSDKENGDYDIEYDYDDEADLFEGSDSSKDLSSSYELPETINHVTAGEQLRGQKLKPVPQLHSNKPGGHEFDILSVQNLERRKELVSVQTVAMHTHSNLITDDHPEANNRYDTLAVSAESQGQTKETHKQENKSNSERWLYGLIAMFLTLDVVLWAYRLSWLSRQLHAAKHGYADRIPTDDACKQVIEIQTAYHLPAFDSPGAGGLHGDNISGYYVDGKDHSFYASDISGGVTGSGVREPSENMTFLQTLPRSREDSILQKIWQQKMSKAEAEKLEKLEKGYSTPTNGFSRHWAIFCARLQRLFLSQLIWQVTLTFLAIILLCLLVHSASFWLTAEHFRVLVGAQSAVSDVQFQLQASEHHLRTLAHTLSQQLYRLQRLCDAEVDSLTSIFFDTVNLQTSMFTSLLQELCVEAKGENCESLSAHLSKGGRIVGCSFLPLQARTYHDLSLSQLEAVLAREVTPLLERSRRLLALSACVVAFLLCARLVCQATASTAKHFLLIRGYLPRVRVYQAEETHNAMLMSGRSGAGASTLQRSQSWVDSCESGVYVCEADDGGMNNGGGAVATVPAPSTLPVTSKDELTAVQPPR